MFRSNPLSVLIASLLLAGGCAQAAPVPLPPEPPTELRAESLAISSAAFGRDWQQALAEADREMAAAESRAEAELAAHVAALEALDDGWLHDQWMALADVDLEIDRFTRRYVELDEAPADSPAGARIDETRPLARDGRLTISNVAGLVRVAVWDRAEVAISGRLGSAADRLDIDGDSRQLAIAVRPPKQRRLSAETVLELKVPKQARLEIETVSADVVVDGVLGPVQVSTISGDLRAALGSRELAISTVSGDSRIKAPAASVARLNTVSGDLALEGFGGELVLETVSGNVRLENGGRFSAMNLKSISGDLHLQAGLERKATVIGQTLSGEIALIVPRSVDGTAVLKSFSGDARCEGAQTVEHHDGKRREYRWGDGRGIRVELSSFSGDIGVERR